jgi:hypothetical protein
VGGHGGPAAGDPGSDGTDRDVEHLGDLGVVEGAEVAEHDGGAELRGQGGQGGVDVDGRGGNLGGVVVEGGLGQVVEARGGSPVAAAELVEAGVGGHAVRPRAERGPAVIAGEAADDGEQRLLGGVGPVGVVAADAPAQRGQPVVVAAQEGLECVSVARLGGGDEGGVGPVVGGSGRGDPAERRTDLRS